MRGIDTIFDRIESPADKLLRHLEPWSSYFVLPIFALANAGVLIAAESFTNHPMLVLGIVLGLLIGKPVGIALFAFFAVKLGLAYKPPEYNWRQLIGVGCLAGIGFTMSLFISAQAFPVPEDFAAAKIAVFIASISAAIVGTFVLWPRRSEEGDEEQAELAACSTA